MAGGKEPNLVLERMPEVFLKVPPLKKILENFEKENFEPKTKPMIQNLQNKLYRLENKQAKGAKFCANIRQELEGEKRP